MNQAAIKLIALVVAIGFVSLAHADDFVQGIDVSHYNGAVDWTSVKADGIKFAFVKVSDGVGDHDGTFPTTANAAIAAGIPIGFYHVAYPHTNSGDPQDAANEANYFISLVKPYYQGSAVLIRPVLDLELASPGQTKAFISQWVVKWANTIKAGLGVDPIVYTYSDYARTYLNNTVTQYPLWFADYSGYLPLPESYLPWTDFKFLQYTSTGAVSGISGNVDRDLYKGTIQDMAANFIMGFLPGDYNGDKVVDAADYVRWRHTLSQGVGYGVGADGDLSGVVDAADYDVWKSHFGTSSVGGAGAKTSSVPEPATVVMLITGIIAIRPSNRWVRRPRRTRDVSISKPKRPNCEALWLRGMLT